MVKKKRSPGKTRKKPAPRKKTVRKRVSKRPAKKAKKKSTKRLSPKKATRRAPKRTVKRKKKRPAARPKPKKGKGRKASTAKRKVVRKVRRTVGRKVSRKVARKRPKSATRKTTRSKPTAAKKKRARSKPSAKSRSARKPGKTRATKRRSAARKIQKKPVRRKSTVTSRSRRKTARRFPKAPARAARKPARGFSLRKLAARLGPLVKPPIEAYRGNKPYIFASYSHKNIKEVFWSIKKLADSRFRIWYDEGIEPGNEWPEEVGRALTGCQLFLVFMSPAAMESRNVRNEINFASSENKSMMVVFLQPAELSEGMKLQIGTVQFIHKNEMKASEFLEKMKKVLDAELRI